MTVEDSIDFRIGGWDEVGWRGVGTGILSFGIASDAAAGMYVDELFVVGGVVTHVVYDTRANGSVLILVAVELIGEGVEETVAC